MTRAECEKQIAEKLMEIKAVYEQYMKACGVTDNYLTLTVWKDSIRFNNSCWEHENNGMVDYWGDVVK